MATHFLPCNNCSAINKMPTEKLLTNSHPNCGKCGQPLKHHNFVIEGTDANFEKIISKVTLPIVVDFWAEWCGPCKQFAPTFETTAKNYLGKFLFVKLNTEEQQRISMQFQIRSIPTLMIFKNGSKVEQLSGALPKSEFEKFLNRFA